MESEKKVQTRFIYVRDNKGFPIGCIAYRVSSRSTLPSSIKTYISYGYSLWNPKDKFNKKAARQCAEGRMRKKPVELRENGIVHPNDMLRFACEHISTKKYMPWPRNDKDKSLCELSTKFRRSVAKLAQKLETAGLAHKKVA